MSEQPEQFTSEANFMAAACCAMAYALADWPVYIRWLTSMVPDSLAAQNPDRARAELTEALQVLDGRYMIELIAGA